MSAVSNIFTSPAPRQRQVQPLERVESTLQVALMLLAAGALVAAAFRAPGWAAQAGRAPFARYVPLIVGAVALAAGGIVTHHRQNDVAGRVFAMFCAALALGLASPFQNWAVAVPLIGGLLLAFVLVYPSEVQPVAGHPALRWAPMPIMLAGLALIGVAPAAGEAIATIFGLFAGLGAIATLAVRALLAGAPTVREQARLALPAAIVSFGPLLLRIAGVWPLASFWGMLALVVFPVAVALSERRRQTIDARQVFGATTAYGLIAAAVAAGYTLLVAGLNVTVGTLLGHGLPATSPILVALLSVAVAAALEPLRNALQERIDRTFFRSRASYADRIGIFRRDLMPVDGLDEIAHLLKQQAREGLMPTHVYVFLQDPLSGDFVAAGDGPRPDTDVRFEADGSLAQALSASRGALYLEFGKPLPPALAADHTRLAIIRTPIVAPLQGQRGLLGFVAIGPKRSGEPFELADLHFAQGLAEQASFAVARARVADDLERREHELDVLSQIAQAINFTSAPEPLMELVYVQASKLIDMTSFSVIQHHAEARALGYRFYARGSQREAERVGEFWPDSVGLAGEVVRTGRPIVTRDYSAECARRGVSPHDAGARAWMGVPLNTATRTLGLLVAGNNRAGAAFNEQQLKVLWAIADQMATALDKARLSAQAEARAGQIAILNQMSTALSPSLELEGLLQRTIEAAIDLTGSQSGGLYLLDGETSELVLQAISGDSGEPVGTRLPLGVGTAGEAIETGAPIIHNVAAPGISVETPLHQLHADSVLAAPLRLDDATIGVIEVIGRRDGAPFGSEEATLLTTFAGQAAAAIENARLAESYRQGNRSRAELISFVAHELKNPITSIRGYSDLLKSGEIGEINPTQTQFLTTIRNNIDRMALLITDLSDAARIEAGHLVLDPEPTAVDVIVEEALQGLEGEVSRKNQSLSVRLEANLPLIDADPARMVQVLTNLISNASKYTPEGGRIAVGAAQQVVTDPRSGRARRVVHHWVRDNGIGISEADQRRIFDSFYRAEGARNMAPGTGLGLSITRSLVESHGGEIWVESIPGSGSTFHFTIPVSNLPR